MDDEYLRFSGSIRELADLPPNKIAAVLWFWNLGRNCNELGPWRQPVLDDWAAAGAAVDEPLKGR